MVALVPCAAVGVRDIQPERTVRTQYPAQLAENLGQPVNVLLRRVLPPNLHIKPIIPKRIVGRACDATVYAFLWKLPQGIERVPVDDCVSFQPVHASPTSSGFVVITR